MIPKRYRFGHDEPVIKNPLERAIVIIVLIFTVCIIIMSIHKLIIDGIL